MTNKGFVGFPSTQDVVPDGSIAPAKLSAPSVWGRLASGRYYFPVGQAATGQSAGLGVGTLRVYPWFVPNAVTLSVLGAEVTSGGDSGSKVRLGIFADNGTGYPGALILDAGTIAGDSATVQDIAVNVPLQPGLYWVGGAVQVVSVTQPTVRTATSGPSFSLPVGTATPSAGTSSVGLQQTSVTGVFPAVFTSTLTLSTLAPRLHVKVA